MTLSIKGESVKNKPAISFVVPFATTLSEISHLGVADRWLKTPKRTRYSASIAKKGKHMNEYALTQKRKPAFCSHFNFSFTICFFP